jgi:hypothetical protein
MSYSPDHDVHDPPIDDLEGYREHLRWQVSRIEAGEMYRFEERSLFDTFEDLLGHCEFLDAELKIEVRAHWWINISASCPEMLYSGKTANEADLLSM